MPTPTEVNQYAKVSEYLAGNELAKGSLFGKRLMPNLNKIIYAERKALEWMLGQDSSYETLQQVANYVLWLCGKYQLTAQGIISGAAGGTSVSPVSPSAGTEAFPIYITSSDFTDATAYDNPNLVGQNVLLFVNEVNRFLFAGEGFYYTSTGIVIRSDAAATIPGFDSTAATYNIVILKTAGNNVSNAAASSSARVRTTTLTANATIANPLTDPLDGEQYTEEIIQGGSGGYTVTWGSKFKWSISNPEPVLSTDVGAKDVFVFEYDAELDCYNCISQSIGFNQSV